MAYLIVDDEVSTRKTLREILNRMGYKGILEASDGLEALQCIEAQGSRIRLIISDWEMPNLDGLSLASKIAENPSLDSVPFLLITSDLPASELKEFETRYQRVDGHLIKPFRIHALEQALNKAYLRRCQTRAEAVYVGPQLPASISSFFQKIHLAKNLEELQKHLTAKERKVGIIFLEANSVTTAWASWLKQLSRNPERQALMVCVGQDPEQVLPLRECCKIFVKTQAASSDWKQVLEKIRHRIDSGWQLERHLRKTRASLIRKQHGPALKTIAEMLDLDPSNPEILAMQGEVLLKLGKPAKAIESFLRSLEENPCLPRPYIRLLELAFQIPAEKIKEIARHGLAYCPNQAEIQELAQKILGT